MTRKTPFSALPLSAAQLANLASLDYQEMTEIQAQSLPLILDRKDVIAQAKTGSGKTAAFGLGLLHNLNPTLFAIQALVICPTRELADQVAKSLRQLARHMDNIKILTLCGGSPMGPQIGSLEHGAHIIVGTPGRLHDHLARGTLDLRRVSMLVLDEADRMIDMGFYDEVVNIVRQCPKHRQTMLFSATYTEDIRKQSAGFLRQPVEIKVESFHDANRIEQRFYDVEHTARNEAAAQIIEHFRPVSTLAFCNTKIHCRELTQALRARGLSAAALYGDMEQRDRDEILVRFANRSCSVLVATDVAARGLDIASLDMVLNVDVSRDAEVHVHRIGRTGRGKERGLAVTLASSDEKKWVRLIEEYQQGVKAVWHHLNEAAPADGRTLQPPMSTLEISSGRKDKLRPGDVLGALTGEAGFKSEQIGKINVFDFSTYVAVEHNIAFEALKRLGNTNIKGKRYKVRLLDE
ncbi:ATP-dependent RNA helicase DbpA [Silvimonas amylolytica]|uniref:ATP-dependent RNA helicase n=1 Tax=Silvimonas amylolytica TaxID=449663 RepID=A0ABQ2PMK1_9NEIS|nr:ATP-dependent RNA helicase DbpA [Silvimonas amylolytica]GGP26551.1 ATP-dependent RNA helicase [Silvimonas amylolytica]